MSVTLKIANVWRVLRDVNLEAIRASAEARFVLAIVADTLDDGFRVRSLLSATDDETPHPWVFVIRAADGLPTLPQPPLAGLLVAREATISPALAAARDAFARSGIPVLTVVVGPGGNASVPDAQETVRISAPSIDSVLGRDLTTELVALAGPDWRLALARQFPALRGAVVATLIEDTAQANASYALATGVAEVVPVLTAPMNLGDMIILTKNQLVMGYRIALASGLNGEPRRLIPELLAVLGGGLLFRQLARQLVGLVPVLGLVPKVAVAYGGTYAIGRAVASWAAEGRAVSGDTLQRFSREGLERGRELARVLVQSRRREGTREARGRDLVRRYVARFGRRGHAAPATGGKPPLPE
jgi:uncharacterized protein (DUF697 family)